MTPHDALAIFRAMTALSTSHMLLSVEEFLAAEPSYEVKHEYLGGMVYEMAGASTPHVKIGRAHV